MSMWKTGAKLAILIFLLRNVLIVEMVYVIEYVPARSIETAATSASRKEFSESIPILASDMMEPSIVINEIGTGNDNMIVNAQSKTLFFIVYLPSAFFILQSTFV